MQGSRAGVRGSLCCAQILSQVAELCAAGGVPLSTVTNRDLAASLAAAERVAPDKAAVSLIKSLATRAMSEAQYFSAGGVWYEWTVYSAAEFAHRSAYLL